MRKNELLSAEERWEIIHPILEGKSTIRQAEKQKNFSQPVIRDWIRKYKQDGMAGLENGKGWKHYSAELKRTAVEDVVLRGISRHTTVKKYGISSTSTLRYWIKSYNSGKELVKTSTGGADTRMIKGRKTTLEERIEITEFIIARDYDYRGAQEKYNISYSQAYSWTKKYEKEGRDGLLDRRGEASRKNEADLSEEKKLKLEIKRLKERNEFLEMKDSFGKKLKELERRYGRFR